MGIPNRSDQSKRSYLLEMTCSHCGIHEQTSPWRVEKPLTGHHVSLLQVIVALAAHLNAVEAEKQKLRAQVRRLGQENKWLLEELSNVQQKLQNCEQSLVQVEEEKKHLEFMNQLKKYNQEGLPEVERTHYIPHDALKAGNFFFFFTTFRQNANRKMNTSSISLVFSHFPVNFIL